MIFQTEVAFWQGKSLLTEAILQELAANSKQYDQENRFCHEDIEILQAANYFKAQLAADLGGNDLSLSEIAAEQARLAAYAPATALAVNMHQIIIAMAKHMQRSQIPAKVQAAARILKLAQEGAIFAFGISEASNDRVLFASTCKVEAQADATYRFNGQKVFMSLSPIATHAVVYGMLDLATTKEKYDKAQSLFAIVDLKSTGITIEDDWDVLGMRATGSNSVKFNDVALKAEDVLSITPIGPSFDPVVFGIFATFEILLGATYYGIANRALELGISSIKQRQSLILNKTMNNDPLIRRRVAVAALNLAAYDLELDGICRIFEAYYQAESGNAVHSAPQSFGKFWLPLLSALKNKATEAAVKVTEEMLRSVGGRSYYNSNELSRLYRDVLAGLFQPSDQESLQNAWANILLGPIEN